MQARRRPPRPALVLSGVVRPGPYGLRQERRVPLGLDFGQWVHESVHVEYYKLRFLELGEHLALDADLHVVRDVGGFGVYFGRLLVRLQVLAARPVQLRHAGADVDAPGEPLHELMGLDSVEVTVHAGLEALHVLRHRLMYVRELLAELL